MADAGMALRIMVTGSFWSRGRGSLQFNPTAPPAEDGVSTMRQAGVEKRARYFSRMPANETLLARVRELLEDVPTAEEKAMFNGVTFMVDGKMCICVLRDGIMCRIGPDAHDAAVEESGVEEMHMGGRGYRGYVVVEESVIRTKPQLQRWVDLCQHFNPQAQSSKKKSSTKKSAKKKAANPGKD